MTEKASKLFLKIVLYLAIGMIIVIVSSGLLFFGAGYRIDFTANRIYKTGLVLIDSAPARANIYLDGKLLAKKTPTRIENLIPGIYKVEVKRDGFSDWANSVEVKEDIVTFLQYIVLLPKNVVSKKIDENVTDLVSSNKGIVGGFLYDRPKTLFTAYNLENHEEIYKTPLPIVKDGVWKIENVSDHKTALLSLKAESGVGWYSVNADGKINDLEKTFNEDIDEAGLHQRDENEIYARADTRLLLLNIKDKTKSALQADTLAFTANGRNLYTVVAAKTGNALIRGDERANNPETLLKALPQSALYRIFVSRFENKESVAVLANEPKSLTFIPKRGTGISPSVEVLGAKLSPDDGHFLAYYDKSKAYVHNFEDKKTFTVETGNPGSLEWLFTGYHFLAMEKDGLHFIDFDGANKQKLSEKIPEKTANSLKNKKIYILTGKEVHEIDLSESFEFGFFSL